MTLFIGGGCLLQVGDKIVYPMHGAGIISAMEECEVMGQTRMYYVLKMPLGNMKVMIPTDTVDTIGLREIISKEGVDIVKQILTAKPEHIAGSWNKRFHTNLDRLKSGDICDAAAVTRNLLAQDSVKKISSGERRLLDLAKQILITELVYACDKTPESVETWVENMVVG